jgi:peptidoglycan/LPS O-acetylase OafA/YrhL
MFLRLGRLYPLHIFVLCMYLPIAFSGVATYTVSNFWTTALLLQTFSDGNLGNWNPPSWSISAEIWTYSIFALLSGKMLSWLLGSFIIAAPTILLWTSDRYLDVCFQGALLRCLFGFSMGVMAFMFLSNRDRLSLSPKTFTIIELIVTAASMLIVSIAGAGPLSFLCPPVFVVAVFIFAHEGGVVSSMLKTKPLALIGLLSYSIYMTHLFIQARLLNFIGGVASRHIWLPISKETGGSQTISSDVSFATDITIILMIVLIIGFAYLTFTYIEEPFRRWSRSAMDSPKAAVTP